MYRFCKWCGGELDNYCDEPTLCSDCINDRERLRIKETNQRIISTEFRVYTGAYENMNGKIRR